MPIVKIGSRRQVTIPRKIHHQLGLAPGDVLEIELQEGRGLHTQGARGQVPAGGPGQLPSMPFNYGVLALPGLFVTSS